MLSMVPTNSLKRDEIYTFICGLFVGSVYLCFLYIRYRTEFDEFDFYFIGPLYIMMWLLGTAAIFILQSFVTLPLFSILVKNINSKDTDKLKKYVNISGEGEATIFSNVQEEILIRGHLTGMVSYALLLSWYPAIQIAKNQFDIYSCFGGLSLASVIVLLMYIHGVYYFKYLVYSRLQSVGFLALIDKKVYEESRAKFYAELRNKDVKG